MIDDYVASHSYEWGDKFTKMLSNQLDPISEYILKCHLQFEHEIDAFIEKISYNRLPISKSGFSFSQKVKIATMFGAFEVADKPKEAKTLEFVKTLNEARNQVAHNFKCDDNVLLRLLNIENYFIRNSKRKDSETTEPGPGMCNKSISFICGFMNSKGDIFIWTMEGTLVANVVKAMADENRINGENSEKEDERAPNT